VSTESKQHPSIVPGFDPLHHIQAHLGSQDQKLDRILKYLEGDDLDPEKPGIKVRLDRIEQFIATEKKIIWGIVTLVVGAIVTGLLALVGLKGGDK
jgi:hypothetical protein